MNNVNLQKLVDKAGEMALRNIWGENAYKINMAILRIDNNNTAACTRLAKYYKLNDNIAEAKNDFAAKSRFSAFRRLFHAISRFSNCMNCSFISTYICCNFAKSGLRKSIST